MSENKPLQVKKSFSPDWLVRGVLTKLGETFDKLTGRNWKPSSSLATSELVERLIKLLDSEVKDLGAKGRFVPHIIKLKIQWNKFSTDAEDALKSLENELLTAAVDHINDRRYHTYAPLKIEVKTDYFTEGVRLTASFDDSSDDEREAAINVTVPGMKREDLMSGAAQPAAANAEIFIAEFEVGGKQKSFQLEFGNGKRLSVGRTRENALTIEDPSVSKVHATLFVNAEGKLLVADTGSTNGTFLNNERIAYGRAFGVGEGDKLKFGDIEVFLRRVPKQTDFVTQEDYPVNEDYPANANEEYAANVNRSHAPTENYATNENYPVNKDYPATNEVYPVNTIKDYAANEEQVINEDHSINKDFGANEDYPVSENYATNKNYAANEVYPVSKDQAANTDYAMTEDYATATEDYAANKDYPVNKELAANKDYSAIEDYAADEDFRTKQDLTKQDFENFDDENEPAATQNVINFNFDDKDKKGGN